MGGGRGEKPLNDIGTKISHERTRVRCRVEITSRYCSITAENGVIKHTLFRHTVFTLSEPRYNENLDLLTAGVCVSDHEALVASVGKREVA